MPTTNLADGNFLIPNGTFFVEVLAFLLMLWVLAKFIVPPINRAMMDRQAAIRQRIEELDEAKANAQAAEEQYKAQLAEARHEAARIREEAREEGAAITAELREKAQADAERIVRTAHLQVEAERQQVVQQLRRQVGTMATTLAERIVGESLQDDARRERTVEAFIATLESQDAQKAGAN